MKCRDRRQNRKLGYEMSGSGIKKQVRRVDVGTKGPSYEVSESEKNEVKCRDREKNIVVRNVSIEVRKPVLSISGTVRKNGVTNL